MNHIRFFKRVVRIHAFRPLSPIFAGSFCHPDGMDYSPARGLGRNPGQVFQIKQISHLAVHDQVSRLGLHGLLDWKPAISAQFVASDNFRLCNPSTALLLFGVFYPGFKCGILL
jgi:hypothetical protein